MKHRASLPGEERRTLVGNPVGVVASVNARIRTIVATMTVTSLLTIAFGGLIFLVVGVDLSNHPEEFSDRSLNVQFATSSYGDLSYSLASSSCTWSSLPFGGDQTSESGSSPYGTECNTVWEQTTAEQIRRVADTSVLVGSLLVFSAGFVISSKIGRK